MKTITAIEFIRPNARQRPYQVEVSDAAAEKFNTLTKLGLRLTVEDLGTGLFNTCIELPGVDDVEMDICPPSMVNASFEKMLIRFNVDSLKDYIGEDDEGPTELEMFPDLGDK